MKHPWFRRDDQVEALLRAARHRPGDAFASTLARQARKLPAASPGRRIWGRVALAGGISTLLCAALAATGGIGYAASTVTHVVAQVTDSQTYMGTEMAVQVKATAAATDQYGNPENSSSAQTVEVSDPTQVVSSSVSLPGSGSGAATTVKVVAPPGAFTTPVTIHVDPAPPTTAGVHFLGSDNRVIAVNVTDSTGHPVKKLEEPLDIDLGPDNGQVPSISEDGSSFRWLLKVAGPGSALSDHDDGYYRSADGHIHILTLHLTIFALLFKGNITTSESGRTLKKAGSGQFGDPTLIHQGPANLKRIGAVKIIAFSKRTGWSGRAVRFTFNVDEQVAAYVSVWDGKKKLPIALRGTQIRGTTLLKKGTEKTLHVAVLRLGNLSLRLRIPGTHLVAGKHYRIRVATLDYDGNRTVRFIPFTG